MKNKIDFFEKNEIEILFAKSKHNFPLHSHRCFCFGVVEDGEVVFSINGKQKKLQKGMAYIIPPNTGVSIESKEYYRYITICIKGQWKEKLNDLVFDDYFLSELPSNKVQDLCQSYLKKTRAEQFVNGLIDLMAPVISKQTKKKNDRNNITEEAAIYIIKNADKKFCLDELAKAMHISKYYLVKIFKKEMGVTPNQYYIQAKMYLVKRGILQSDKTVELAMELNFNDQSHLCNLFKRQMGITLNDYKRSYTKF